MEKTFTYQDIKWIKNISNGEGTAFMNCKKGDEFDLTFSKKTSMEKILEVPIGDIVLLWQGGGDKPQRFTHLVVFISGFKTPQDDYWSPYSRRVKVIAIADDIATKKFLNQLFGQTHSYCYHISGDKKHLPHNKEQFKEKIWNAFKDKDTKRIKGIDMPEMLEGNTKEGKTHLRIDRNATLVNSRKEMGLPNLECEVCGFSFVKTFGANFIECHHIIPLSKYNTMGKQGTKLKDLALVCSNCHSMLHKKFDNKFLSIEELKKRIKK